MTKSAFLVVGTKGSGKGTFRDILSEIDFHPFSLSKSLREYAKSNGIEVDITSLQDLGNKLREERGNSALAEIVWNMIKERGVDAVVIDGIRHLEELLFLKSKMPNSVTKRRTSLSDG